MLVQVRLLRFHMYEIEKTRIVMTGLMFGRRIAINRRVRRAQVFLLSTRELRLFSLFSLLL